MAIENFRTIHKVTNIDTKIIKTVLSNLLKLNNYFVFLSLQNIYSNQFSTYYIKVLFLLLLYLLFMHALVSPKFFTKKKQLNLRKKEPYIWLFFLKLYIYNSDLKKKCITCRSDIFIKYCVLSILMLALLLHNWVYSKYTDLICF